MKKRTYNDDSICKLDWSPKKRKITLDAIPLGIGWFSCNCNPNNKGFCSHYLGMCMPYSLCLEHSKIQGFKSDPDGWGGGNPQATDKKCDRCILISGLYY